MVKNFFVIIVLFFFTLFSLREVFGQNNNQNRARYANCDLCGYCPPNPPPQNWLSCKKCLYPNAGDNPEAKETLIINPETNLPPTPIPGKQYTFFGCLGGGVGFSNEESRAVITQRLLNVIFSFAGGIAFLYLIYGSFIIISSQSNPERLNYGKRVVTASVTGLIFTLSSILIVNIIVSNIIRVP